MRGVAAGVVAMPSEAAAGIGVIAADDRRLDHHDADMERPQDCRHDAAHQAIAQLNEQPGIVELHVMATLDVAIDDIALQPSHRVGYLVLVLPVVDQRSAHVGIDHALEQQHRRLGLHDGWPARRVELRHPCCDRIGRRLWQHFRHTAGGVDNDGKRSIRCEGAAQFAQPVEQTRRIIVRSVRWRSCDHVQQRLAGYKGIGQRRHGAGRWRAEPIDPCMARCRRVPGVEQASRRQWQRDPRHPVADPYAGRWQQSRHVAPSMVTQRADEISCF